MRLSKKMFLYFSALALILIILFFTTSKYIFNASFENYKLNTVENENKEYINLVEEIYKENNGIISNEDLSLIKSSIKDRVELKFLDNQDKLIWEITMKMPGGNMGIGQGRGQADNISYDTYGITNDSQNYGNLKIGRLGRYNLSEEDINFQDDLNNGILFISLTAVLITIIISTVFSRQISKPILKIKESTQRIRDKKQNWEIKEKTKTYELDELLKTINSLGKTLEAQENLRVRLTSDVSHELRTPLNVMQNQIEAMQDGIIEINKEKLEEVRQEVLRLSNLAKDLENLTDISNYNLQLNLTETDLSEFIKGELINFKNSLNKDVVEVDFINKSDSKIILMIDKNKFKQVLLNLFSNAEKYSKDKLHIRVEVEELKENALIKVIDKGMGISETSKDFIFERFYREEKSRNRGTGGAGLGLSIVKGIVEAHNGEILLNTDNKEETEFIIKIPKS
ncbi:MAG: HAMP domain-containing sensor histidine kinase [Eubacteriales bacterium]